MTYSHGAARRGSTPSWNDFSGCKNDLKRYHQTLDKAMKSYMDVTEDMLVSTYNAPLRLPLGLRVFKVFKRIYYVKPGIRGDICCIICLL